MKFTLSQDLKNFGTTHLQPFFFIVEFRKNFWGTLVKPRLTRTQDPFGGSSGR